MNKIEAYIEVFKLFSKILEQGFKQGSIDYILAVGGDGIPWPSWLKDLMKYEPWKNRLTILGPQSENRIAEILSIADIGLVPTPFKFWEKRSKFIEGLFIGIGSKTFLFN